MAAPMEALEKGEELILTSPPDAFRVDK